MVRWGCAVAGLLVGAMPVGAYAQDQAAPPAAPTPTPAPAGPDMIDDAEGEAEIVVTGQLRGAVQGDIPPELQLNQADIRAYGVSSIAELLTELAPQTGSARGRGGDAPVVLLNGRRISSFAEIRDVPTEAIERVDILPEEVALKYGYRADQRVVNFVLRERFRAVTAELEGQAPTAGGYAGGEADLNLLRISRDRRISFDAKYQASSGLLESERDIVPTGSTGLFDPRGNVTGLAGGEIDPALSAIAGTPVTVAGVPASAAAGAPGLAAFLPGANQPNAQGASPYRTLISPSQQLTGNAVYSRNLSSKVAGSINARIDATRRTSLLGLPGATLTLPDSDPFSPFADDVLLYRAIDALGPLRRTSTSLTAHGGASLNGEGLPWSEAWRWSLTGNYDRVTTRSTTQTGLDAAPLQSRLDAGDPAFNPFGPIGPGVVALRPADTARSTSSVGSVDALLNGPLFKLPAGDVSTSVRLNARTSDFDSRSIRGGVARTNQTARDSASLRANLDLPIASRRRGVLDALGDLSLNANIEVEQLSDFGTLVTTGYGVNWSPLKQVRLIASFTDEEGAPSANQLGDPVISTPNVRVFDYVRGETAAVTVISGGNPGLGADSRHVMKLGLNLRPFEDKDFNFSADYVTSRTRNQISAFPAATAEVEAAFPQRFMRDASGRLLSADTRPVNFASAERSELRWGFNFSMPLSSSLEKRITAYREQVVEARRKGVEPPPPPESLRRLARGRGEGGQSRQGGGQAGQGGDGPRASGPGGQGPRRAGPGGGGRRGGFGGPNGALAGRLQFALYHTWHLKDQVRIRDGLPVLDLLDGAATGSRGGQSEHEVEAHAGLVKDGVGARLITKWQSGTHVNGGVLGSGDRLDFSSLATVNLRLFADLGRQVRLVREHRWLRGTRVSLSVDNLFDSRQRVTDANGQVPLSYQPGLIDPAGRTIRLSIRKLFF